VHTLDLNILAFNEALLARGFSIVHQHLLHRPEDKADAAWVPLPAHQVKPSMATLCTYFEQLMLKEALDGLPRLRQPHCSGEQSGISPRAWVQCAGWLGP
jgi:hypothetical protein